MLRVNKRNHYITWCHSHLCIYSKLLERNENAEEPSFRNPKMATSVMSSLALKPSPFLERSQAKGLPSLARSPSSLKVQASGVARRSRLPHPMVSILTPTLTQSFICSLASSKHVVACMTNLDYHQHHTPSESMHVYIICIATDQHKYFHAPLSINHIQDQFLDTVTELKGKNSGLFGRSLDRKDQLTLPRGTASPLRPDFSKAP